MTYDSVLAIFLGSSANDWQNVDAGSATFLYGPGYGDDEQPHHHTRMVYRPDVTIGLALGLEANPSYEWDWVEAFANKRARSYFIDLLYNGQPVDRRLGVVVDGGRAVLPSPLPSNPDKKDDEEFVWTVGRDEYEFVRASSRATGSEADFDRYFEQSAITIDG